MDRDPAESPPPCHDAFLLLSGSRRSRRCPPSLPPPPTHPPNTGTPRPRRGHIRSRCISQRTSARPASSIAVFGSDNGVFHVVRAVNGTKAKKSAVLDTGPTAVATSINPVGGRDGLLCNTDDQIFAAKRLRTSPHMLGNTIDASRFTGEGGENYNMFCYSNAVHGGFGLATADSQGLVQLIRKKGHWKIDKRVKFPGLNNAGNPHRPGWIDIRDSTAVGTLFDQCGDRTQGPAQRQVPRPALRSRRERPRRRRDRGRLRRGHREAEGPRSRQRLRLSPSTTTRSGRWTTAMPAWPSSRAPPTRRWCSPGRCSPCSDWATSRTPS